MTLKRYSLFLGLLLLTSCNLGPAAPLEAGSLLDRWVAAVQQRDYAAAQQLMVAEDFVAWRADTERLFQQHQALESYRRSDQATPPNQPTIVRTEWTWQDGFVRCLRVQVTSDNKIALVDPTYQDCAAVQ